MNQALKVGIFMTICLLVLGWLVLRIEDLNLWGSAGQRVDALFDSVAGLDDKSAVRVAGVRVGRVDGIRLEGRRARVTLLLETPMTLVEGTRALVSNMGLLGDKYVELIPGPDGGRPLAAGETIAGETPISFDQAMAKLESIGDSIQSVTSSLAGGGGEGEGGIGFQELVKRGGFCEALQDFADEAPGGLENWLAQFDRRIDDDALLRGRPVFVGWGFLRGHVPGFILSVRV